ncbi:MAG: hypothetical protein LW630_09800 [Saprospiraceae bacterium]|nr:hypothetical protein [Saprospiraceae bacterium]
MKSGLIKMQVLGILFLFSQAISAQFDDTYFNAKDDAAFVADFKNETPVRQRQQEEVYSSEEENENLDEYSYSSRIDRFHRNGINGNNYSNFDNWWSGCDSYSPSYGYGNTFNTGIYYGSPWGGGFGYSPVSSWGMSPWNSFGWNSWNPFWGYNSWNNWGFTPMSMYNWPYYGGGYGFGNSYFINNYYGYGSPWVHHGNGWNGWNNGNGGETTDKLYMSRKGGSVSSPPQMPPIHKMQLPAQKPEGLSKILFVTRIAITSGIFRILNVLTTPLREIAGILPLHDLEWEIKVHPQEVVADPPAVVVDLDAVVENKTFS